jgi:hypothetical protein
MDSDDDDVLPLILQKLNISCIQINSIYPLKICTSFNFLQTVIKIFDPVAFIIILLLFILR